MRRLLQMHEDMITLPYDPTVGGLSDEETVVSIRWEILGQSVDANNTDLGDVFPDRVEIFRTDLNADTDERWLIDPEVILDIADRIRYWKQWKSYAPCKVCGVVAGEACKYVNEPGKVGDLRPTPHFYRTMTQDRTKARTG